MSEGHIELARAVTSIRVGRRARSDLGDLDELAASIKVLGLLQPITVTPDGTLICGARRYAAVMQLGWKTVNVWVRSGISTDLERLLAEQHENTIRKNLTPTEAARLYAELKTLYQEDAARRQQATQFGVPAGVPDGAADSAGPSGETRAQAAKAITGRRSDFTLEHVLEVDRLARDRASSEHLRGVANRELAAMDNDGTVHGHFLAVRAAQGTGIDEPSMRRRRSDVKAFARSAAGLPPLRAIEGPARLEHAATAALARAREAHAARRSLGSSGRREPPAEVPRFGMRAFLLTINDTDYWWLHYDPAEIGAALTAAQWEQFDDWIAQAAAFAAAAHAAARSGYRRPTGGGDPLRTLDAVRQPIQET